MTIVVDHPCDAFVADQFEVRHDVEDTVFGPQPGGGRGIAAVDRRAVAGHELRELVAILEPRTRASNSQGGPPVAIRRPSDSHLLRDGDHRAEVGTELAATSTHTATSLRMKRPATSTRVAADPVPIAAASA